MFSHVVKKLLKNGKLHFAGSASKYRNRYEQQSLLDIGYGKEWVPYCKKTFQNAVAVLEYLGRYTHRIVSMVDSMVTYRIKDYGNDGCWKKLTISGV